MTSRIAARRFTVTVLRFSTAGNGAGGVVETFAALPAPEQFMASLEAVRASRMSGDQATDFVRRRTVTASRATLPADFSDLMRLQIGGEDYQILEVERTGPLDRDRKILVSRLAP